MSFLSSMVPLDSVQSTKTLLIYSSIVFSRLQTYKFILEIQILISNSLSVYPLIFPILFPKYSSNPQIIIILSQKIP